MTLQTLRPSKASAGDTWTIASWGGSGDGKQFRTKQGAWGNSYAFQCCSENHKDAACISLTLPYMPSTGVGSGVTSGAKEPRQRSNDVFSMASIMAQNSIVQVSHMVRFASSVLFGVAPKPPYFGRQGKGLIM